MHVHDYTQSGFYIEPVYNVGVSGWQLKLWRLAPDSVQPSHWSRELKGYIQTGVASRFGEKSCYNVQIPSSVYAFPSVLQNMDGSVVQLQLKVGSPTGQLTKQAVTHIISYGSVAPNGTFSGSYRIFNANKKVWGTITIGSWRTIGSFSYTMDEKGKPNTVISGPDGDIVIRLAVKSPYKPPRYYCPIKDSTPSLIQNLYRRWVPSPQWADAVAAQALKDFSDPEYDARGTLVMGACKSVKAIDINTAMYIRDLFEISKTLGGLKRAAKESLPKAIADTYLTAHYGIKLTAQDTKTLCEAVNKAIREARSFGNGYRSAHSRLRNSYADGAVHYRTLRTLKIWYSGWDCSIKGLINSIMNWDLFPELSNVYDYVPYSFVFDWVIPLSTMLEQIDTHTYLSTLSVAETVWGTRHEVTGLPLTAACTPLPGCYCAEGLTVIVYNRAVTCSLPSPKWHIEPPEGFSNWVPAGALLVQRLAR